jgi:FixJ family two-component response regulator
LVERANIVLLVAEGKENLDIAAELEISRHTVAWWRDRFLKSVLAELRRIAATVGTIFEFACYSDTSSTHRKKDGVG